MSDPLVTIFADFTSAASYLTEVALWSRAAAGGLRLETRAFESFPAPAAAPRPSEEEVRGLEAVADELGVALAAPALRPHTRKAHELARLARGLVLEEPLRRALYRAYWENGADLGRIDVLQEIGAGAGLDPIDVKIALDIDRMRDEVLRDEEVARRLRIPYAPVVFLGTGPAARVLVGVQSTADLDAALRGR